MVLEFKMWQYINWVYLHWHNGIYEPHMQAVQWPINDNFKSHIRMYQKVKRYN